MTKPLIAKHSYNSGDLIASMPGLKHFYEETGRKTLLYQELDFPAFYYNGAEHPIKNAEGQQVSVNQTTFDKLHPLITAQEYIEDFKVWNGETADINFMKPRDSRAIPLPYGSIFHWPFMSFPDLYSDLSKPWLTVERQTVSSNYLRDKIIINRTSRYTNPNISYYFLKQWEDRVLFIGTNDEWVAFNTRYSLNTGYLLHENFFQYAQSIQECKLFIGNQSLFWHIANSIGKISILEVCSDFPNCYPTTGGYSILYQNALEHLFKKQINQE